MEWLRSGANEGQSYVSTESTTATESSGVMETIVTTESNSTTVRNIGFIVSLYRRIEPGNEDIYRTFEPA